MPKISVKTTRISIGPTTCGFLLLWRQKKKRIQSKFQWLGDGLGERASQFFFGVIKINFLLPIFGEEYSQGSQEWTFSIKKEIYCKNFSLLILPTKAFRRFLPKLCAFSPRHQWLGILVIPTHINSQSPENAINPINLATNILLDILNIFLSLKYFIYRFA